jgi:ApaG protein
LVAARRGGHEPDSKDAAVGRIAEAIHVQHRGGAALGKRSGHSGAGEGIARCRLGDGSRDFDEVVRFDARGGLGKRYIRRRRRQQDGQRDAGGAEVTEHALTVARRGLAIMSCIMPDLSSVTAPMSEAVTHGVRVEVLSRYSAENSRPLQDEWVFQYTVRITNQGSETVQLISRHWIITDALDHVEEVQGPGVIGEQPVLAPGESFKYSSWCPLKTPMGMMHGTYQMVRPDGRQFDIEIAPFALKARYSVN